MRRYIYLGSQTTARKKASDRTVKSHALWALGLCLALLLLEIANVCSVTAVRKNAAAIAATVQAHLGGPVTKPFPDIPMDGLSDLQRKVVTLARAQYAKHPTSFDSSVLTYTQDTKEAWCADFASWVMQQAGAPYTNPYSGSWRIPGVYTLQEYYQAAHRYEPAGSYTPQTGDIAFYIGRDKAGAPTDGHVAIVLSTHAGSMTTIGGNEGGRMLIDTQPAAPGVNRLAGFGILQ